MRRLVLFVVVAGCNVDMPATGPGDAGERDDGAVDLATGVAIDLTAPDGVVRVDSGEGADGAIDGAIADLVALDEAMGADDLATVEDLAMEVDSAMADDLAVSIDSAMPFDQARGPDFTSRDLPTPPRDLSSDPPGPDLQGEPGRDLATAVDLTMTVDLLAPRDLAMVLDLSTAPDLAMRDLAMPRDLATAPDLVVAGPACAGDPEDPATGQRCPIFTPCMSNTLCGVFKGCQLWFCDPTTKQCRLNALSNCGKTEGVAGNCGALLSHQYEPPVDKRFLVPDGVNFRELASLAITVKNNTNGDLYLDRVPLLLDVMNNGSQFDVAAVKVYEDSGGVEFSGDLLVCSTGDPFSFPANGTIGPCGLAAAARIAPGASKRFLFNLAFAANKTFIKDRAYRLRMTSNPTFRVGYNGPTYMGTVCGMGGGGFAGAWLTAKELK